jgi:hypothetical protein
MSANTIRAGDPNCPDATELACDLALVEHRLRDLRRWTPAAPTGHLDAALASLAAALDCLHAEGPAS